MLKVVGVRFKKAGKVYYFDPGDLSISQNDSVIVETARGMEFGEAVVGPKEVSEEDVVHPLKRVVRIATEEDIAHVAENQAKATEAFKIGLEKISKHELPMKLIDVEFTFDDSKVIFYFTAEGRVDFRELVKDLASVFRTRIELRQIGVRDEAKMIGGLGPCGRPLCCATFLGDFEPVSIRMAKDQSLSLNPTKISGICGRLMCCLKYEADMYKEKEVCSGKCAGHCAIFKVGYDLGDLEKTVADKSPANNEQASTNEKPARDQRRQNSEHTSANQEKRRRQPSANGNSPQSDPEKRHEHQPQKSRGADADKDKPGDKLDEKRRKKKPKNRRRRRKNSRPVDHQAGKSDDSKPNAGKKKRPPRKPKSSPPKSPQE